MRTFNIIKEELDAKDVLEDCFMKNFALIPTLDYRGEQAFRVMVETCMSVTLPSDYQGKKPWQWSVNAAVGAEYTFISQLGVYLEPSLGYYFCDGSNLEHYYKEHPLAPSIEFGLRMHIGR